MNAAECAADRAGGYLLGRSEKEMTLYFKELKRELDPEGLMNPGVERDPAAPVNPG
jgi:FAD/FMN-containing dehydrogenase